MGYFQRTKIQKAVEAVVGDYRMEEYTAAEVEEAWNQMDRCLKNVDDDEPIFVLRAQDGSAVDTIIAWLQLNPTLSVAKYLEANDHIRRIHEWQQAHPERVKVAD